MSIPTKRLARVSLGTAMALFIGCAANQGCRDTPQGAPRVLIQAAGGEQVPVEVELARRASEKSHGLMYREKLAEGKGMLFIYVAEGRHTFWMKNTYIPLDLLFIGSNMRVVGIVKDTRPLSLERIGVDIPSKYILEVNAGFCERHAIREGARVRFEGFEPDG